ncbi:chromosome segregation SMC family protein, partial [Halalkalibacterium ligniniphilum]|uniref:chromosome segregation SMC family protein n=1 Tax=Halalkalibacterium ligniniphilum TaxID=1134413 RepID=UPI00036D7630
MFLKRLEVIGFKSFAEQISIDFVPGVTAVVGPNGSGKSNISDGIRWVLGEQSAKSLRGSKMEDIIFAGSDTRKPLNFAEVSLILDNEDQHIPIDYSEVSVTRRVYRSGESEYYLNRQACRLKDIVDLFMDSGLGREAYSIIGQGKVEEILSSKAEDRRVIFEEAAGVLKYKTRKQKAEKRLDETQENLYRVDDILYELEGQVEPLMIQASIAKDYLEKKAELKDVEVSLMVYEIGELHKQWSKEKEDLEALRNDHANKTKDVKRHEESIQSLREQLKDIDEDIRHLQETLLSASEELEKNEGRREVLKERKKNFTQNREQLMRAIEEARRRKNELAEELEQEEQAGILAKNQVKELQTSIKEKEALLAAGEIDLEKELDRLKSDYIEVLNEQASLRNEKRYIDEQLRLQGAKHERLLHENEHLIEARAELEERQANQQQLVKECETELDEAIKAYRSEQARAEQLRRDYEKNESKLYEAYQLSQRIQSRKDVLEELQADFSGFFQGVK